MIINSNIKYFKLKEEDKENMEDTKRPRRKAKTSAKKKKGRKRKRKIKEDIIADKKEVIEPNDIDKNIKISETPQITEIKKEEINETPVVSTDNLVEEKKDINIPQDDKNLLEKIKNIGNKYGINIYEGRIGSGDVWNKEKDRIKFFNEKYETSCEEMEIYSIYNAIHKIYIDAGK